MAEAWMTDVHLVQRLLDAGVRLVQACRLAVGSLEEPSQIRAGPDSEGTSRLVDAVALLRQLLQQVPVEPPAASDLGVAARRPCDVAPAGSSRSVLLHLPDDLLRRVARLAGKGCRTVCNRLRDAYGLPSHTVKQPMTGFEVELITKEWFSCGYRASVANLQRAILQRVYQQHASEFTPVAILSCSERWPGWAGQVTRLELSDTYKPDAPALRLISEALPNLRELVLAPPPPTPQRMGLEQEPTPMDPPPPLVHLTQLCLLCSSHTLLTDAFIRHPHSPFSLLPATPSLRSLHLDLRHLRIDSSVLQPLLQPLQHLTHLELVFGPEEDMLDDDQYMAAVLMALTSLADRLQSLVFLTPVECLGEGAALPVLQSLTRLTSLGWCIGWDDAHALTGPDTDWLQLPDGVQQLVLGYANPHSDAMQFGTGGDLARGVGSSQVALPALQSLVLPPLFALEPEEVPQAHQVLHGMLSNVVARCPGLSSLHCGCLADFDADLAPARDHWLRPVARLQKLQQLVLLIHDCDLDELACLAGLPLLSELWLDIDCAGKLLPRLQRDPRYQPGSGLVPLVQLTHLSLRPRDADSDTSSSLAHALLPAAARLPRLQVLDLSAAELFTSIEEPWLALATRPPPQLHQLRLCSPPPRVAQVAHQRTLAVLEKHLPPGIKVTRRPCYSNNWGPTHETLGSMSVRLGRSGKPG